MAGMWRLLRLLTICSWSLNMTSSPQAAVVIGCQINFRDIDILNPVNRFIGLYKGLNLGFANINIFIN
jgi:hypothetical protein